MSDERPLLRWLTFNGVGLLGLAVQLAVVAALTRLADVHYLAATAVAVEATLLHNFAWHQRWTWRDRPCQSSRATAARLARFHLLNGSVSLVGNIGLVRILTGQGGVDPIVANVMSVAACSLVNFLGSHLLVFAAARPRVSRTAAVLVALSITSVGATGRVESPPLEPATVAAWQSYEKEVDERYAGAAGGAFFARDAFAGGGDWRRAAEPGSGGVPVLQLHSARPGGAAARCSRRAHPSLGRRHLRSWCDRRCSDRLPEAHAGEESV